MSERIANIVKQLGLENEAVVITGGALEGAGIRDAQDVDLSVSAQAYKDLRETSGWIEGVSSVSGVALLSKDNVEVAADWGELSHAQVQEGAYKRFDVSFAGLHTVYAQKEQLARPKDIEDLARIRTRLYESPLHPDHSRQEQAFVKSLVPEYLYEHPAVGLAANGLYLVRTIFGKKEDSPGFKLRMYSGDIETFPVLSTYHDYDHTAKGMARMPEQVMRANMRCLRLGRAAMYSQLDLLALIAGYSYHDAKMGHGRQASNENAYDELQSAELVRRHAILCGIVEDAFPEKVYQGVRATTFNQTTNSQDVDWSRGHGHIQVGLAGTDLGEFAERLALLSSLKISIEDGFRVIFGRPLGKRGDQVGNAYSMSEVVRMIDDDPELTKWFGNKLISSGTFCLNHVYPEHWMLDDVQQRMLNGENIIKMGRGILDGSWRASDLLLLAQGRSESDTSAIALVA